MKHLFFGFLAICLTAEHVFATEIDMNTKVESVTIYHSGALVKRTATNHLNPGMNTLIFKNVSSKMVLNSLKVGNKQVTVLNKSIINKLSKEAYRALLDRKDALNKQLTLIEAKYNEPGFISKVEDLEKMTEFYAKQVLQTKKEIRNVEEQIEQAKNLEDIQLKNEDAAILKLIVSIDGNLKEPFSIQYVCGGIGWSPAYEVIVGNPGDNSIEVKYLAKAMSQTGEDWDNVTINLSSSFPLESPTQLPKPQEPWVLKGGSYNTQPPNQAITEQDGQFQKIDKLEGVTYQDIRIPSFLKSRTLKDRYSIKSNSTVFTFPIETVQLPTHFYYYGFPSIDPEVYLVAQVTGWDTLGFIDGIANITFDGNDVGKSVIKFSESKDTLLLPIGKDNSVFMKRSEIADQKYFKVTTFGKKRKTTLAYHFELKNNNAFPIEFKLFDQVPISQTKSAAVEMEQTSKGSLDSQTGEISWLLDLKPGQTADKELIYTIDMNSDYHYYKGRKQPSFRTVSAPSF